MADIKIVLLLKSTTTGDQFQFADNEIPEFIRFGGIQKIAVHELIGGGRVVDVLGQQPRNLEWSGWFLGTSAFSRAKYLDELRVSGLTFELSWYTLKYKVVISEFVANFERYYKIPYTLSLTVSEDDSVVYPQAPTSVDDQMASDIAETQALTANVVSNAPPALATQAAVVQQKATIMQKVLAKFGSASDAISKYANLTSSNIATILTPIGDLRMAVQQLLAQTDNLLQNVSTLGGVAPNNPLARNVANLTGNLNALNSMPDLVQLDSVLGRMSSNVAATPAASKTVTVTGGSLYTIAEQQYGDATAWTTIANANGLTDPQISGTVTLLIPPAPGNSGGVLNG